jgi:predicted extracellular nuclease
MKASIADREGQVSDVFRLWMPDFGLVFTNSRHSLWLLRCLTLVHTLLLAAVVHAQVEFPAGFLSELQGREVVIANRMYITGNYGYDTDYRTVVMAPEVLMTGTEVVKPGVDYQRQRAWNNENKLTVTNFNVDDATVRVGAYVDGLQGVVTRKDGAWTIRLTTPPVLCGNERPDMPLPRDESRCNLRVVSFNLHFFLASPSSWGSGYGADDAQAFERQRTKILAALAAMDADIYALCEVEEGDYTISRLTGWLNDCLGVRVYKYVDAGDTYVDTYTKNAFIYRSDRVLPVGTFTFTNNDYLKLRHIAQRFRLRENGEELILSMNHLKSKSGNGQGADADKGDGQSSYNYTRVKEAEAVLNGLNDMVYKSGETDVLVMGDLNAYSYEDPLQVFMSAGYVNELRLHSPQGWSYCFGSEVGYLDHILASSTLANQVVTAMPWDINASEPRYFNYTYSEWFLPEHYTARCSDHNPVLVSLDLGHHCAVQPPGGAVHIRLCSLQGEMLMEATMDDMPSSTALWKTVSEGLPSGVYILTTSGAAGVTSQKFLNP